jgi:hypothetical protein
MERDLGVVSGVEKGERVSKLLILLDSTLYIEEEE